MKIFTSLFLLLFVLLFTSCNPYKNIAYFKDVPDSIYYAPNIVESGKFHDPLIQPNDILQITILTLDPQVGNIISTENPSLPSSPTSINSASGGFNIPGYLVDKNGEVDLPLVGKIKVAGLTTANARDLIYKKVSIYYKEPVVNVRFANFTVTVLGEVAHPGQYVVSNEKVSVIDAIGMAGDLTIYGKRNDVLLIRSPQSGKKEFIRFNLNSSDVFKSEYFYLHQDDVVYIEPNKSKAASTDITQVRNLSIITSVLTLLIVAAPRIKL